MTANDVGEEVTELEHKAFVGFYKKSFFNNLGQPGGAIETAKKLDGFVNIAGNLVVFIRDENAERFSGELGEMAINDLCHEGKRCHMGIDDNARTELV